MACKTMNRPYHKLQQWFGEFYDMDIEAAEVKMVPNDYASLTVAYNTLRQASRRSELPIEVCRIDGSLFLIRTDWSFTTKRGVGRLYLV